MRCSSTSAAPLPTSCRSAPAAVCVRRQYGRRAHRLRGAGLYRRGAHTDHGAGRSHPVCRSVDHADGRVFRHHRGRVSPDRRTARRRGSASRSGQRRQDRARQRTAVGAHGRPRRRVRTARRRGVDAHATWPSCSSGACDRQWSGCFRAGRSSSRAPLVGAGVGQVRGGEAGAAASADAIATSADLVARAGSDREWVASCAPAVAVALLAQEALTKRR